jgi:hypothetical protein
MGISHVTYPLFEVAFKQFYNLPSIQGLTMIELGNQHLRDDFIPGKKAMVAKKWFTAMGIKHISIDLNGKDGALKHDLSKPMINFSAEIVTNFGTIEHVKNQFQVFRNIHNATALNGVMIHTVPEVRSWIHHCCYWYTDKFFKNLADICGYKIILLERRNRGNRKILVCAVFKKIHDTEFTSEDLFNRLLDIYCEAA